MSSKTSSDSTDILHAVQFFEDEFVTEDQSKAKELFSKLIDMDIPKSILTDFGALFTLEETQTQIVMIEYLKYLVLEHLFPGQSSPFWLVYELYLCHLKAANHFFQMCKNIFGYSIKVPFPNKPNCELYLSVFNHSPAKLIERQQPNSRVEVNLLRIVIYSFFEKGLVQRYLVSKDKLNSQKAVHFDHNVDIDQIAKDIVDNKPTLGVAHGLKLKNLLKNRASRSEYYEENKDISKLSWRNNFPATSFPK